MDAHVIKVEVSEADLFLHKLKALVPYMSDLPEDRASWVAYDILSLLFGAIQSYNLDKLTSYLDTLMDVESGVD